MEGQKQNNRKVNNSRKLFCGVMTAQEDTVTIMCYCHDMPGCGVMWLCWSHNNLYPQPLIRTLLSPFKFMEGRAVSGEVWVEVNLTIKQTLEAVVVQQGCNATMKDYGNRKRSYIRFWALKVCELICFWLLTILVFVNRILCKKVFCR